MKFEIRNPHDPYTLTAPDLEVAAVAICLLGYGAYPLKGLDENAGTDVPAFIATSPDPWFIEKFGANYETVATKILHERPLDLVNTLESVHLNLPERSSMNDIKAQAVYLADKVRQAAQAHAEQKQTA